MHTIVVQYSPDGAVMKTDFHKSVFTSLDVTLGFFEIFESITQFGLCVILVSELLLGKISMVLNCLRLYTICLPLDWWSPNSLEIIL